MRRAKRGGVGPNASESRRVQIDSQNGRDLRQRDGVAPDAAAAVQNAPAADGQPELRRAPGRDTVARGLLQPFRRKEHPVGLCKLSSGLMPQFELLHGHCGEFRRIFAAEARKACEAVVRQQRSFTQNGFSFPGGQPFNSAGVFRIFQIYPFSMLP